VRESDSLTVTEVRDNFSPGGVFSSLIPASPVFLQFCPDKPEQTRFVDYFVRYLGCEDKTKTAKDSEHIHEKLQRCSARTRDYAQGSERSLRVAIFYGRGLGGRNKPEQSRSCGEVLPEVRSGFLLAGDR